MNHTATEAKNLKAYDRARLDRKVRTVSAIQDNEDGTVTVLALDGSNTPSAHRMDADRKVSIYADES